MPEVHEERKGVAWEFLQQVHFGLPVRGTVLDTEEELKKDLLNKRTNGKEDREVRWKEERA